MKWRTGGETFGFLSAPHFESLETEAQKAAVHRQQTQRGLTYGTARRGCPIGRVSNSMGNLGITNVSRKIIEFFRAAKYPQ